MLQGYSIRPMGTEHRAKNKRTLKFRSVEKFRTYCIKGYKMKYSGCKGTTLFKNMKETYICLEMEGQIG
jgi:hypothetical protein